jgi:hypothetical protein
VPVQRPVRPARRHQNSPFANWLDRIQGFDTEIADINELLDPLVAEVAPEVLECPESAATSPAPSSWPPATTSSARAAVVSRHALVALDLPDHSRVSPCWPI